MTLPHGHPWRGWPHKPLDGCLLMKMLKKGLMHGAVIFSGAALLMLFVYFTDVNLHFVGLLLGLVFFLPLAFVGYRYRVSTGSSIFGALASGRVDVMYYPVGIAVYTALFAAFVSDVSVWGKMVIFPVAVAFHASSFGTIVWIGSLFGRRAKTVR